MAAKKHKEIRVDPSISDVIWEEPLNIAGGGSERKWLPLTAGLMGAAGTLLVNGFTNGIIPAAIMGPLGIVGLPALAGTALVFGSVAAGISFLRDVPQKFLTSKRMSDNGEVKVRMSMNQAIGDNLGGVDGKKNIRNKTLFGIAAGIIVSATMFPPAAPLIAAGAFVGGLVGGVTSWLTDVRRKGLSISMPSA